MTYGPRVCLFEIILDPNGLKMSYNTLLTKVPPLLLWSNVCLEAPNTKTNGLLHLIYQNGFKTFP